MEVLNNNINKNHSIVLVSVNTFEITHPIKPSIYTRFSTGNSLLIDINGNIMENDCECYMNMNSDHLAITFGSSNISLIKDWYPLIPFRKKRFVINRFKNIKITEETSMLDYIVINDNQ